jgi:hypothetical protein
VGQGGSHQVCVVFLKRQVHTRPPQEKLNTRCAALFAVVCSVPPRWPILDSLRCTARLHYLPEDIAVAAIMKALRQHDIAVRKCGERHAKDVAAAEARGEGPLAMRPWHEVLNITTPRNPNHPSGRDVSVWSQS